MRTLFAVAALVLLVAPGCGDDTTMQSTDMAMSLDMTAPTGDMAKIATCQGIISCIAGCSGNAQCSLNCQVNASASAEQYFQPFAVCLYGNCSTADGGTGDCPLPPTTNPSQACGQCLGSGFVSATMAGKPCHTEYANCAAH